MNLTMSSRCALNCSGAGTDEPMWVFAAGTKTYMAHIDQVTLEYDGDHFAIRVERANVYTFEVGDTFAGVGVASAADMYTAVYDELWGVPVVASFYILAETGDILNAENSDKIRTE